MYNWGGALKKHIHKLQVLQNKTVRKITNAKYNDPVKAIYNELGISTLDNLYKTELCKLMYLNSNKALPKPILSLYTSNTEIHNHNTRHKRDAHITSRRSQLVSRSFIHRSPEIWLQIPGNIKSSKTMNSFKHQIQRYLVNLN